MGKTNTTEYPVIWLQCATCTGCSVSVLNSVSPTIKNVLVDEVIPGKHVNLRFHTTVMAGVIVWLCGVIHYSPAYRFTPRCQEESARE